MRMYLCVLKDEYSSARSRRSNFGPGSTGKVPALVYASPRTMGSGLYLEVGALDVETGNAHF